MPDLRAVALELDAVVSETVLVYGSAPAAASDLDLLVRPAARDALEAWLPTAGFTRWHRSWVRVRGATQVVDLVDAAAWGLSPAVLDDLFTGSVPLDGLRHLSRPGPAHALLVLGRRARAAGRLDRRWPSRVAEALREDPTAGERARDLAADWACTASLGLLLDAHAGRWPGRRRLRAALRDDGRVLPPVWRAVGRRVLRRGAGGGVVVALAGGPATVRRRLAGELAEALRAVGRAPVVRTTPPTLRGALGVAAAAGRDVRRGRAVVLDAGSGPPSRAVRALEPVATASVVLAAGAAAASAGAPSSALLRIDPGQPATVLHDAAVSHVLAVLGDAGR